MAENTGTVQRDKKGYRLSKQHNPLVSPWCPHGPTLLFEKTEKNDELLDKFYACAACRDRKDCSFYQKFDCKENSQKAHARLQIYQETNRQNSNYAYVSDKAKKNFCTSCCVYVPNPLCSTPSHSHSWKLLSDQEARFPSRWIDAKKSNQTNAQYFFSEETTKFVLEEIHEMQISHVVCIGTPSIYEHLAESVGTKSCLLDIDVRLRQFYKDFSHFNMFNGHFFDEDSKTKFKDFLFGSASIMLVIDPPYGGMLEALSLSINNLLKDIEPTTSVSTMLFFPYYLEHQVLSNFTDMQMSDYKVNYSNHQGYRSGPRGNPRGSPARIYTNISLENFVLPETEGYRFCEQCKKYVSKENKHCSKCSLCTTKDGPTYKHCDLCERCTKPSRVHCSNCERCELQDHKCFKTQDADGCFLCGDSSHKKRRCPKYQDPSTTSALPRKRKRTKQSNNRELAKIK